MIGASPRRVGAALFLATVVGGAGTGCGSDGPSTAEGKEVFRSAGCATCHTMKDAGATGTVGPNLDDMQPGEEVVDVFVRNGSGGTMPSFANKLSDGQIKAVAKYVAEAAGGGAADGG